MAMSSTQTEIEEPGNLCCPITYKMFRDPVLVCRSGQTYERSAIEKHFRWSVRDPLSGISLPDRSIVTNVLARKCVEEWLNDNPGRTPDGWKSRKVPPAKFDSEDGKRTASDFLGQILSFCCHYIFWVHVLFISWHMTRGIVEEVEKMRNV